MWAADSAAICVPILVAPVISRSRSMSARFCGENSSAATGAATSESAANRSQERRFFIAASSRRERVYWRLRLSSNCALGPLHPAGEAASLGVVQVDVAHLRVFEHPPDRRRNVEPGAGLRLGTAL